MARLKNISNRLTPMKPSLSTFRPSAGPARDAERMTTEPWRAWYKTAEWRALRLKILERDGYRCRATGVPLHGKYPDPDSPVIDHIIPHLGDPRLFWDESNLQAISRAYHDSQKKAQERAQFGSLPYPRDLQPAACRLTIVCGPPAGGKSHYVSENAGADDIVIDLDQIASRIALTRMHAWPKTYLNAALRVRNEMLRSLTNAPAGASAWFIVGEPRASGRKFWRNQLKPQSVIVLLTTEHICREQAKRDADRDFSTACQIIDEWWYRYEPDAGDTFVRPKSPPENNSA